MTGYGSRPSDGLPGGISFEQELVDALNDFANTSPAPSFDATGIQRRARRKRAGLIATVAAVVAVAGGGTALATVATSGSSTSTPAAAATDATTVLLSGKRIDLTGMDSVSGESILLKSRLKIGTVTKTSTPTCKPNSVIGVSPHSPQSVAPGDTIDLTICATP
ncbi:hypothetical protein QR77_09345 [Streptomyces sp. 150FB]|uniref:PASTA domain-containing protein n=1 Tax=Streptomyces sp. 150FB TaxID=1576605 RepID=UPI0005890D02|nr:PASTA domain-containing protein [Streptomyces sp. 150FB]KIF74140.1 hypothetical protein QR77_09345 [Streptomyces sp. 150FB]